MLDWLKDILGDSYTEDIDKKISQKIGEGFVAKSDFNQTNETKKQLETQIADRDKQLEELKKLDAPSLQAKITQLQDENAKQKSDYEQKIADMAFSSALDNALSAAGAKNVKAVKALLDTNTLILKDGKIVGLDDQLTQLKKTDGYLLNDNPDVGSVQSTGGSKEKVDFSKMTYSQMVDYAKTHPNTTFD